MKKCSMQKKIESLKKKHEDYVPYVRDRLWELVDNDFITVAEIGDYLLRSLSVDTLEKVYGWLKQDEMIPSEDTLEDKYHLQFNDEGRLVPVEKDESKKNENGAIRYVPLKEIRAWLRDPKIKAVDISDWSFSQCKELKNNHTLETICISTGTYGPSGGVFEDEDGTYYVCTHRGTGLTYLAP